MKTSKALITSTRNPHIIEARGLRLRKKRDQLGKAYVEGINSTLAAIESGADIEHLIVCPNLLKSETVKQLLENSTLLVLEVTEEVFRSLSKRDGPQGIAAVVRQIWSELESIHTGKKDSLWIALDSAADEGNIGSIIRTSEAVSAAGVILIGNTADPYSPLAIKASTGALFYQDLIRCSWDQLVNWARKHGVRIVGTSGSSTVDYRNIDRSDETLVVMGSERAGLSEIQQQQCDLVVSIPMNGKVDSLNVSSAATLLLYELSST